MSLKTKLILLGTSVVIVPFCIAGIITYAILSKSLLDVAQDKSLHFSRELSLLVDANLRQEVRLVKAISADPAILKACQTGNFKTAREHIKAMHNHIGKEYFSIFILDRDGIARAEAVFSQQEGLDLSNRPYFKQAKLGRTAITGPLKARGSATPGAPVLVVTAPVLENGRFWGLAAIVFSTDFLMDILSESQVGNTGYAYLLDEKGLVLAHPKKEYILELNLLERPGGEIIRRLIQQSEPASATYQFQGVEKILGVSGVGISGWKLVFSQDKDEIMAPLNRIMSAIFLSALALLAAVIPIIAVVWGKVSNPLQMMMDLAQTFTRHSQECIVQIGPDRRIRFANPAFLSTTGQRLEDIIGSEPNLDNENMTPPQEIWEGLEDGNTWLGRIIYEKTGTEPQILDTMILPLKGLNGSVKGYLEIGKDITQELQNRKRMQQAQKLEAIGTLSGGIAHDFNNILSGLYGYAQLALSRRKKGADIEKYINQIVKGVDRARDLVSQILVFSRQKEVDMEPMYPKPVIKEALKLLRASIPVTIQIESNISGDDMILASPTQIHQIVMNLVTNAAHAIGNRTGSIRLDLERFLVDREFMKTHPGLNPGNHLILRISDTGCGMDPDIRDRIFEPFFTTKTQEKGTGLGLSVIHGIVKKMNGIITVYSEPGKGTVFNIIIPCRQPGDAVKSGQRAEIRKGNEKIVIVDDEAAITDSLQMILTDLGYRVTAFTDPVSALNTIKSAPDDFELLITDYTMPHITGPELVRMLTQAGITMPVVLTSGYYSLEMEEDIRDLKISHLLRKPIDVYRLSDAIGKALESTHIQGPS